MDATRQAARSGPARDPSLVFSETSSPSHRCSRNSSPQGTAGHCPHVGQTRQASAEAADSNSKGVSGWLAIILRASVGLPRATPGATRRHSATSPHGGLYALPSLCGSALATREWFRAFVDCSFLTCRPLRPRRAHQCYVPSDPLTAAAFAHLRRARHSRFPPQSERVGPSFRGFLVRFRYNLPSCLPPCRIRRRLLPGFRRVGHPSRRRI